MAQNRRFNGNAIQEQRRALNNSIREAQIKCEHKSNHGPTLKSVHDADVMIKGKNNMSDDMYICDECGDVIEIRAYDGQEIDNAMYVLYGMCSQAKVLGDLSDTEYENICNIISVLDDINATLKPFYLKKLIKQLSSNNKGKGNNNNNRTKGRVAISSNSFNR